jgi:hypothetical protein
VVPEAPRYKRELRPELIRGSAVAVSEGRLLASCGAVGGRREVGLVRHNKYYKARVARAAGGRRGVCELLAPDAPLAAARGFRSPDDLRVGEPVYAILNRTSAEFLLAEGRLAGKRPDGSRLEVSLGLLPGAPGAVLLDGHGNLLGLGLTGTGPVSSAAAAAGLAPGLANRDLGPVTTRPAAAAPSVDLGPALPPLLVRTGPEDDDDSAGTAPMRATPEAVGARAGVTRAEDEGEAVPDGWSGWGGGPHRGTSAVDRVADGVAGVGGRATAGALDQAREQAAGALGRAREQAAGALGRRPAGPGDGRRGGPHREPRRNVLGHAGRSRG